MLRRVFAFSALCFCVAFSALPRVAAADAPIDLEPDAQYLLDPEQTLTVEQVINDPSLRWQRPANPGKNNFGYRDDAIWIRAAMPENPTSVPVTWRLDLRKGFLRAADAWVVDRNSGEVRRELSQSEDSRFSDRPLRYRHLAVDLAVQPQQSLWLVVRYRTSGLTEQPLLLETVNDFALRTQSFAAKSFMFQGIMLVLVLAGVVTFVVSRARTPLMYGAYLLGYALFVFHRDGYAFQFLWPDLPALNTVASLPLGGFLVVAGSFYTRMFLRTAELHPIVDRILLANAAAGVATVVLGFATDIGGLKQAMVVLASGSTLLFFAAGANAARTRFKEVRFFVIGWLFAILAAGVVASRHLLGLNLSSAMALDGMRIVAVLDAMMMGLALIDRYLQNRARQMQAIETSLEVARDNLRLHDRLAALERRYSLAEELARSRERVLADATHDLRQPIHALRMTVQSLVDGRAMSSDDRRTVEGSFHHLEELVEGHLAAAARSSPDDSWADVDSPTSRDDTHSHPAPAQSVRISTILQHVQDMFADDARAKGLDMRVVASSASVVVNPLALMRVLSNLVSNAIKYTPRGRVLVGCRRRGDELSIQVIDTGPGMDAQHFERMMLRCERAEQDQDRPGFGLGLAIVTGIAREQQWRFEWASTPGTGTQLSVRVPLGQR